MAGATVPEWKVGAGTCVVAKSLDVIATDLLAASEAALLLVNTDRQVVAVSRAAARMFESEVPALTGRKLDDLVASTPAALAELCRTISARGHQSGLVELLTQTGRTRQVRFSAIALAPTLHLTTLHDASRASGRRDPTPAMGTRPPVTARIAAAVGHEIRGPLATARLYIDIALRHIASAADGSVEGTLAIAREQIQRIESLVSRTVEMHRLGRAQVRAAWVDAGRVVSETVRRTLEGDIAARVIVEIGSERLIDWWDETAVEQIVQNLLSNALKFGEGRPVHVAVEGSEAGIRISVRDHGIGIAVGERERIFSRHVRAPVARSGGLGLGLWMVRELAEAHAGAVAVESQPGMGSIFTVTLRPLRPPG